MTTSSDGSSFWHRTFAECRVSDTHVDIGFESPKTFEGRICRLEEYFDEANSTAREVRYRVTTELPDDAANIEAEIRSRLADPSRAVPPAETS